MLIALLRKIFLTLITLIILSIISFSILQRDPLNQFTQISWFEAYYDYIKGILHGDLGISFINGESLVMQILHVFPATITLCISALFISLLVGIPLGFLSARQGHRLIGKLLKTAGMLSLSIPVFWLAIVALHYASVNQWEISAVGEIHSIYPLMTVTGFQFLDILISDSPYKLKMLQSALQHLALPTLILSVPATLEMMRYTQERAEYVMKQPYITLAKNRGWSTLRIWWEHVLCNTLPALVPSIIRTFIIIFAFGMLIETIFSWSGIGRWLIQALESQDYNAISAGVMAIGSFILLVDMLSGLIRVLLDPSQQKDWYEN